MLSVHSAPVFGAAKTVEHEVAALQVLRGLSYLPHNADEYDLVEKLRITRAKARAILYHEALRHSFRSPEAELQALLLSPRIQKDHGNGMFLIDVPSPLTMDRLRKRVRELGYLSDGSFGSGVAKIPEPALIDLVEQLIPSAKKQAIRKFLVKQGAKDGTVRGVVVATIAKAAKKVASEVGEDIARSASERLADALSALFEARTELLATLREGPE